MLAFLLLSQLINIRKINNQEEIWKDIEGYNGVYQISNLCRVKSYKCNNIRILKPSTTTYGYHHYKLRLNNVSKSWKAHRLLAIHFVPNPLNKPCVNHINGIKIDNRVENIEWCTLSENTRHAHDKGLIHRSNKGKWVSNKSKKIYQYDLLGNHIKTHKSLRQASKSTGIVLSSISLCANKKNKTAGGFKWSFKRIYKKQK